MHHDCYMPTMGNKIFYSRVILSLKWGNFSEQNHPHPTTIHGSVVLYRYLWWDQHNSPQRARLFAGMASGLLKEHALLVTMLTTCLSSSIFVHSPFPPLSSFLFHLPSSAFIFLHLLSFSFIHLPLSLTFIHLHLVSFTLIHSNSFTFIYLHSHSFYVTSLTFICLHRPSGFTFIQPY